VGKKSASHNVVLGAVELEEEWLAGLERPEQTASAWLPEVQLVEVRAAFEIAIPVFIGDANPSTHGVRRIISLEDLRFGLG
jgi:hypothetical protein